MVGPRAETAIFGVIVAAATMLATPSCSIFGCQGFALSLASDTGGQPTPVAAADWFADHGGVGGVPGSGWHEDGRDDAGVTLRSGGATLHAVQGPDGTWQIDSGTTC